jgi:hypothetical protein
VTALFLVGALLLLLLDASTVLPEEMGDLYYGIVFGLSFSMIGMGVLYPIGVHLFQTDRFGGSGGMMTGSFSAAWSVLPVRPSAVARGVYLHGLVVGLVWFLFIVGFALLANVLGVMGISMLRFFLPMGLAVPAVAGVLTCTAVGDKLRGAVSFLAVLCIIPAHLGVEFATRWAGMLRGSATALAIDLAALALLGAIGGIPPLVHLRREEPPRLDIRTERENHA